MERPPRNTPRLLLALGLTLSACITRNYELPMTSTGTLDGSEPLRVHTNDGSLVVFSSWHFRRGVGFSGAGVRYDVERVIRANGPQVVSVSDVALVETTHAELGRVGGSVIAMSVITAASLVGTAICIASPKSCFGSCPTFYVPTAQGWALQAEGFSTSIARSLEAEDSDDLPAAHADSDGFLRMEMRNEAQETHFVRGVSVVVAEGPPGAMVFQRASGAFSSVSSPRSAVTSDGSPDVLDSLAARDGREWSPATDGEDLARRASVVLHFAPTGSPRAGLVLTARNSLMNTWVFYHLLARLGREAPTFIAALERRDPAAHRALEGFRTALGGVTVESRQGDGAWVRAGEMAYQGPIAQGTQVVPLTLASPREPVEVRLTFARAHWRLDAAMLGAIVAEDVPSRVVEAEVEDAGRFTQTAVEQSLQGRGERLVTLPGDAVRLRFRVGADAPGRAYFVRSRGYYYEWLRARWLREEDLGDARSLLADPARALRTLAPAWASEAPAMDAVFWQSRVGVGRGP